MEQAGHLKWCWQIAHLKSNPDPGNEIRGIADEPSVQYRCRDGGKTSFLFDGEVSLDFPSFFTPGFAVLGMKKG